MTSGEGLGGSEALEMARAVAEAARSHGVRGLEAREAVDGCDPGFSVRREEGEDGPAGSLCDPLFVLVDGAPLQSVALGRVARRALNRELLRASDPAEFVGAAVVRTAEARFRFGRAGRFRAVAL